MRRAIRLGLVIAAIAAISTAIPVASAETTHTYPVTLTISVDRAAHKISGTIVTDAPSEFCEISTVRVRRVMPGHDKVVAGIPPYGGEWRMKSPAALRGERIYAEVLTYHLPSRPVVCLGARSRTVTAP
jgi:hypothetical protein